MDTIRKRLASSQRWWAAEIGLRLLGLCGLAGFAAIAAHIRRLIMAHGAAGPTPSDFLLCLGAVVLLSFGLALAGMGQALLQPVPRPSRPLLP